ncbi:DUF4277 domain-containing protein [Streptomyces sp. NBC_00019]|uniref:DUF4277 domain-containing protein n=1 Tax=Streptomyces sp. NBC_00019 TaxID=2975623 RepID=UPI00324E1AF9
MVEKRLGALPVAAEFLRRLDVAGVVDELCPGGASAHLTHGQVVEALVANRLTSPAPVLRVADWGRTWAVEEVLGIEADQLNDDRLARVLDAIAPKLERIAGTVGARAITEFGIDVSRLHWDVAHMRGEDLGVFTHGTVEEMNPEDAETTADWQELLAYLKDFYGDDAFDWNREVVYYRLNSHWMTVYAPDLDKLTGT